MQTLKLAVPMGITLLLGSCVIPPLHYFELTPFAKPLSMPTDQPVTLVLGEDVPDLLVLDVDALFDMEVTEFRKSLTSSLINGLEENFDVINVAESLPDSGLSLVIYRVKPFWKIVSRPASDDWTELDLTTSSRTLRSAAFRFESSLFLNGRKLRDADETVYSDHQMSSSYDAHPVFKDGLTKACEYILRELFKDDVTQAEAK